MAAAATVACAGGDTATAPTVPGEVDAEGGVVRLLGGQVRLDVPAGAVSGAVEIRVHRVEEPPDVPGLLPGAVFELRPRDVRFARPVELTIRYDEDQLPAGATEPSLAIHRSVQGEWTPAGEPSVDSARNRIRGLIHGLGAFAVISDHPCVDVTPLSFGAAFAGELSPSDCSIWDGRVVDKFGFTVQEQRAVRASVASEDFTGSVFANRVVERVGRVLNARIGSLVQIVPPGRYEFWPTSLESEASTGSRVHGGYELSASMVEGDPTGGCRDPVGVTDGITVEGRITAADCEETDDGDPQVVRRADEYLLTVRRPEMATVTLTADFPFNLLAWGEGAFVAGAFARDAGTTATVTVDPPRETPIRFGVVSDEEGAGGRYTITFRIGPREADGQ